MNVVQEKLIEDLWAVYYGNPLYNDNSAATGETPEHVLARALIAVLTTLELSESAEVPK